MRRVAAPFHIRALVLAALAGFCVVGCASTHASAPSATRFSACPLGPPWPLPVSGGSLAALSVEGVTCKLGQRELTSVVAALSHSGGGGGHPLELSGWNCVGYGGNQATCVRGGATIYGQYALS
ncbi:MAG TPA: hypothetical protein VGG41_06485 [Solirubrobacteraceae bacterium]|jgi:hypothetical protein